ncbi:hypothetical protein C1H46_018020 [Malus baccata]|uniref:Uncharacterized protein n=1 Tax=Malus baccata TaxID=106549 RepID=A0A540MCC5_MALBA|nr:hypothetical protein C1H46_018020 [Malus baccata]
MFSWLARIACTCWKPLRRYACMNKDEVDDSSLEDPLLWCRSLDRHSYGEFSFAVVQANEVIEDHSQVETGRNATFVGVYGEHSGPDASHFINDHLFLRFMILAPDSDPSNSESQPSDSLSFETLRFGS